MVGRSVFMPKEGANEKFGFAVFFKNFVKYIKFDLIFIEKYLFNTKK